MLESDLFWSNSIRDFWLEIVFILTLGLDGLVIRVFDLLLDLGGLKFLQKPDTVHMLIIPRSRKFPRKYKIKYLDYTPSNTDSLKTNSSTLPTQGS